MTVNDGGDLGDARLVNTVAAPNCPAADCQTDTPLSAVEYEKTITSPTDGEVGANDVVTYRVTAANIGQTDLTGLSFTDDLSDVLEHATYLNDATASRGTVAYAGAELSWNGDLAVGQIATVVYSVRVDRTIAEGTVLANVVVGNGPGSNCPPGSGDPACDADVDVPARSLPVTGLELSMLAAIALLLLAGGALLVRAGRRKKEPGAEF